MAQSRISQIASHLTSSSHPHGLLANKVAIITGSGQGIGAETARLFANEGAKVVVQDIDAEKAHAVAKRINDDDAGAGAGGGGRAIAIPGDMLDATYIDELVAKAAEFGGGKIHIVVNNAGFTWDGVIHKMTDRQWDVIVALHATAPFRLVRALAPWFRVRDGEARCVVNVSSTSGIHGNAVAFGHISTRLTAAKEDGAFITTSDGQKVPLGIPGARKAAAGSEAHADIPLRRPGTATEAASVILAVASPLFSYVDGQTIMVTGGRNM
ncbi:hypothetical protein MMC09_000483 [Bachmanniomyces sp. S44760]|nr:hypothetical protein [Bachmanniomyces sp. S44760]